MQACSRPHTKPPMHACRPSATQETDVRANERTNARAREQWRLHDLRLPVRGSRRRGSHMKRQTARVRTTQKQRDRPQLEGDRGKPYVSMQSPSKPQRMFSQSVGLPRSQHQVRRQQTYTGTGATASRRSFVRSTVADNFQFVERMHTRLRTKDTNDTETEDESVIAGDHTRTCLSHHAHQLSQRVLPPKDLKDTLLIYSFCCRQPLMNSFETYRAAI
jgi:hypothetical protein